MLAACFSSKILGTNPIYLKNNAILYSTTPIPKPTNYQYDTAAGKRHGVVKSEAEASSHKVTKSPSE